MFNLIIDEWASSYKGCLAKLNDSCYSKQWQFECVTIPTHIISYNIAVVCTNPFHGISVSVMGLDYQALLAITS